MTKNQQKTFSTTVFIFAFLFTSFLYTKVFAAGPTLEVQYPTISGINPNADTNFTLPKYVLYLFNAGIFLGFFSVFISLVIAGVQYILSPVDPSAKADANDRISGAISGLLILALTYLIITTINPQLSFLNLNKLTDVPPPPEKQKDPGVYFFKESGCTNKTVQPYTSSIPDFGNTLRNAVKSVGIVKDINGYVAILYDLVNFEGKCNYLDPNQTCQEVDNFADSASVYAYDDRPNGDGVYFYRKSCFDRPGGTNSTISYCNQNSGGYYKVDNSEITGKIYIHALDGPNGLKFQGVPEEEQDCVKYEENGNCTKDNKQVPSLGGENITSIKINGNYIVLLVYFGPDDASYGPWSYCQAFPTINDVNKTGPSQIKWENIRNNAGFVPNYVVIIPVREK
ncbi:MAG: hypothetical protein NTV36_02945 [Candidatus Staskawiczbacteria bacterium]|nr:hypothetical protein [Candidatus Staskawiczbacteria bacterium]